MKGLSGATVREIFTVVVGLLAAGAVIVIVPLCTPVGSEYGRSIRRRVVGVPPLLGSSIIQAGSEPSAVKFPLAPFVVPARGIESSGYGGRNVKSTTAGLIESAGFCNMGVVTTRRAGGGFLRA